MIQSGPDATTLEIDGNVLGSLNTCKTSHAVGVHGIDAMGTWISVAEFHVGRTVAT